MAGWVRVAVSFWFHVNLSSAATGYSITLTYKPEGQQSFDLTIGKLASSKSTFPKMLNCGFEIIAVLKAAVVLANGCLFSFSYPIKSQAEAVVRMCSKTEMRPTGYGHITAVTASQFSK